MIIKNGKIIEATEQELFKRWLELELDDLYAFPEYLQRMKANGVVIVDSK